MAIARVSMESLLRGASKLCERIIQINSRLALRVDSCATVAFVFAPEERDVYSYERTLNNLAPLGAKRTGE
jgi:hypothetical protein